MRWKTMCRFWATAVVFAVLLFITGSVFAEFKYEVIKDPKPNLKEKNFVALEKVDEITDEVAKDVFLFYPHSATMDDRNNLYVYDLMQAKILQFDRYFKFIRSFGGVGAGPGEFIGKGKMYPVFINVGLDKKLYAHDWMARKVSIFDTEGKFIKHITMMMIGDTPFSKPVVDIQGNLLLQEFKGDRLVFSTLKGETLLSSDHKEKKKQILFAEEKIPDDFAKMLNRLPFNYNWDELQMTLTRNSALIVYFPLSATVQVINLKDKKLVKKFNVWPEEAIKCRKPQVLKITKKNGYSRLFPSIFLDGDQDNIFYVDFIFNEDDRRHYVYKLNLDGELLEVLHFLEKEKTYTDVMVKQNNLFVARCQDKIIIYKEVKK